MKKIGIIGGAGPIAGSLLFENIIMRLQKNYNCQFDADFPYILLLSYPFVDMLEKGISQKQAIQKELRDCFAFLAKNDIKLAAIACNTLHAFLEPDQLNGVTLIHMIKEIGNAMHDNRLDQSIVLCTGTSASLKLHKNFFNCSYPDASCQPEVQRIIDTILAGKESPRDSQKLSVMLNSQQPKNKNTGVVLGCTEFSVLNRKFPLHQNGLNKNFVILDSTDIVAEKFCKLLYSE